MEMRKAQRSPLRLEPVVGCCDNVTTFCPVYIGILREYDAQ